MCSFPNLIQALRSPRRLRFFATTCFTFFVAMCHIPIPFGPPFSLADGVIAGSCCAIDPLITSVILTMTAHVTTEPIFHRVHSAGSQSRLTPHYGSTPITPIPKILRLAAIAQPPVGFRLNPAAFKCLYFARQTGSAT